MTNYIFLFVAALEQLELLTAEEASQLADKLVSRNIPADYKSCSLQMRQVMEELKIKPLPARIDFTRIEGRVATTRDDLLEELGVLRRQIIELKSKSSKSPDHR